MRFTLKTIAIVTAAVSVGLLSSNARAQQADSGLQHPFHVAVGYASAVSVSSDPNSDLNSGSGFAVKADYSFFRPTRHEAAVTVWYVAPSGGHILAGTVEYRWRFGGHGAAYYAIGLGGASATGGAGGFATTGGFGYDFGKASLELRGLSTQNAAAVAVLAGYRF